MSICPKNKSSKGRRDKRRANWKMWRAYDATQSLQELRIIQQKRNHSSGLIVENQ